MMKTHVNHQTHLIHSRNPSINSKSAIILLAPAVMTCNISQFLINIQHSKRIYMAY